MKLYARLRLSLRGHSRDVTPGQQKRGNSWSSREMGRAAPLPSPPDRERIGTNSTEGISMRFCLALPVAVAAAALAGTGTAPAARTSVRLISVTSPIAHGAYATLRARVSTSRVSCSITVYYKSGPSHAQGLYPHRPSGGRVSWTWKVGTRTTPGRWPITVSCGSAGSLHTSFRVT